MAKARKKAEQKAILMAQAELRSTRTRRQVKRPDYVYNDDIDSDVSIVLVLEMSLDIFRSQRMARMTSYLTMSHMRMKDSAQIQLHLVDMHLQRADDDRPEPR